MGALWEEKSCTLSLAVRAVTSVVATAPTSGKLVSDSNASKELMQWVNKQLAGYKLSVLTTLS